MFSSKKAFLAKEMRIEIRVSKLNKEKINAVFKQLTEK